jgi:hypothetical protein
MQDNQDTETRTKYKQSTRECKTKTKKVPMAERFSAPAKTGLGIHVDSYTMGKLSLSGG